MNTTDKKELLDNEIVSCVEDKEATNSSSEPVIEFLLNDCTNNCNENSEELNSVEQTDDVDGSQVESLKQVIESDCENIKETTSLELLLTDSSEASNITVIDSSGIVPDSNISVTPDDDSVQNKVAVLSPQSLNITAVTLSDGTTALVQSDIGDLSVGKNETKYIKAQAVQLEDGTTAYIPIGDFQKLSNDDNECDKSENIELAKTLEGHAIELEDGTTAFLQSGQKEDEIETVQLSDGTTAYISPLAATQLFQNNSNINDVNLESFTVPNVTISNTQLSNLSPTSTLAASDGKNVLSTTNSSFVVGSARAIAMGEKAHKCPVEGCCKVYTSPHHLKVHLRAHTGVRPFRCDTCGKNFSTGYGLKSHIRVHTGEKPYKCIDESCGKAFKTSGDLQKHIRTHTGERPFKCPFDGCNRSFTTSNIRKVHMRVHTGERPYVCGLANCGKTFSSSTNYRNHKRIHTGEKPYVCTFPKCQKRFTEYSSLYKHHVVHTMAKPYTCEICGKTYRQTSTLATHRRSYHEVVETFLPENENGAPNLNMNSELKLQVADKLLTDGNVIISKPTSEITHFTAMGVLEETEQSTEDIIQDFQAENKETQAENTLTDESGCNIINIVENSDNNLNQQIYVLADPSQLAFIQQQISNGQLITAIPVNSTEMQDLSNPNEHSDEIENQEAAEIAKDVS